MPTRNVSLTEELDSFVEERVKSGEYDNASEVIRAAIRELKQSEEEDKARVRALRRAVAEGFRGPVLDGPTMMAELRERIRTKAVASKGRKHSA